MLSNFVATNEWRCRNFNCFDCGHWLFEVRKSIFVCFLGFFLCDSCCVQLCCACFCELVCGRRRRDSRGQVRRQRGGRADHCVAQHGSWGHFLFAGPQFRKSSICDGSSQWQRHRRLHRRRRSVRLDRSVRPKIRQLLFAAQCQKTVLRFGGVHCVSVWHCAVRIFGRRRRGCISFLLRVSRAFPHQLVHRSSSCCCCPQEAGHWRRRWRRGRNRGEKIVFFFFLTFEKGGWYWEYGRWWWSCKCSDDQGCWISACWRCAHLLVQFTVHHCCGWGISYS